jgi:hypothetical protein
MPRRHSTSDPSSLKYKLEIGGAFLETVIRIIVSVVIIALLALEGSYVYFWLAKRGRHTSLDSDPVYARIKKCPTCGAVMEQKLGSSECGDPKCLEHRAV